MPSKSGRSFNQGPSVMALEQTNASVVIWRRRSKLITFQNAYPAVERRLRWGWRGGDCAGGRRYGHECRARRRVAGSRVGVRWDPEAAGRSRAGAPSHQWIGTCEAARPAEYWAVDGLTLAENLLIAGETTKKSTSLIALSATPPGSSVTAQQTTTPGPLSRIRVSPTI